MSRADRRTLEEGRGLLLGQTTRKDTAPLIAWPLEGSAITLAPPRTGKGATIAINLLSPSDEGTAGIDHHHRSPGRDLLYRRGAAQGDGPQRHSRRPFRRRPRDTRRSTPMVSIPTAATATYNPLDFIRDGEAESVRDIGVLLDAILTPPTSESQSTSQHFYQSAREIIAGYIAWVRFQEVRLEEGEVMPRNLETVRYLTSLAGDQLKKFGDVVSSAGPFCGGLTIKAVQRRLSVGPEEAGSQASTIANQLSFLAQPGLLANDRHVEFRPGRDRGRHHGPLRRRARRHDRRGEIPGCGCGSPSPTPSRTARHSAAISC